MTAAKVFSKTITVATVISVILIGMFFIPNATIIAQPPSEGVWEISGEESITNSELIINGSIEITASGSLTIQNSNVTFNITETNDLSVTVYGELNIINSNITVLNTSTILPIEVKTDGAITIEDSNINYATLEITSATVDISGSTFVNSGLITIYNCANISIVGNTFTNADEALLLKKVTNADVTGNTFTSISQTAAKVVSSSGIIFQSNTFTSLNKGIYAEAVSAFTLNDTTFNGVTYGAEFVNTKIKAEDNTYQDISEIAVTVSSTTSASFKFEQFSNVNVGLKLLSAKASVLECNFNNVADAIKIIGSQLVTVSTNHFEDIKNTAIYVQESQSITIEDNTLDNATEAIIVSGGRDNVAENNTILNGKNGIIFKYTKSFIIIGNILTNVESGYFIDQSLDGSIASNAVINGNVGFALWSTRYVALASNGVYDTNIGFQVYFSDRNRIKGNEINNTEIGVLVIESPVNYVLDNGIKYSEIGVKVFNSENVTISGNTFDVIDNVTLHIENSYYFRVYYNNFLTIANDNYATIIGCLGDFYINDSNVLKGNYYEAHPNIDRLLIDEVTINGEKYEIWDEGPLSYKYVIKPSIEYMQRNNTDPTDQDAVRVEAQVLAINVEITVKLQYLLSNETEWRSIDITSTGQKIGQIGNIKLYYGIIPKLRYNIIVVYRIELTFTEQGEQVHLYSENQTYVVQSSEYTPVIIKEPKVYQVYSYVDTEGVTVTTTVSASECYAYKKYIIVVEIINQTVDIAVKEGKRQVFFDYTIYNPTDKSNTSDRGLFFYNSTINKYIYELETNYYAGIVINYKILVVDSNGVEYWSLETYTIEFISPTTDKGGFDTATLTSIAGVLFLIQTIVVLRRRKKEV